MSQSIQPPVAATHTPRVSYVPTRKRRRFARALRMLRRHLTPKRLVNLCVVETERLLGRTNLRGKPYMITIDPTNYCNLRCPLCPTGNGMLAQTKAMLTLKDFKRLIDQVSEYAFEISLMNWGEPLLNAQIFEMIRYCHSKRLSVSMSTNLTRLTPDMVDPLLQSGLDYLIVSLDGVSQEAYSHYRVGGDVETVRSNLRQLISRRSELGQQYPEVRWQFIVMKHNEHEMAEAQRLADEIGVDDLSFIPVGLPITLSSEEKTALAQDWFASTPENRQWDPALPPKEHVRGGRCPYLYRMMVLNPTGGAQPCCIVYGDSSQDFGNLLKENLIPLWNNEKYLSARSVQTSQGEGTVNTTCHGCPLYSREPGLKGGIKHLFSL